VIFGVLAEILGGSAEFPRRIDGRYFLISHGWRTEVSQGVWIYSICHWISAWVILALVPVFMIIDAYKEWDNPDSTQEGNKGE
jgi:hypothetical protein